MKFGGPLAIIVHNMVQFNLECNKALYQTWAIILFRNLKKIIIRRLKSEITKISNIQSL